MLENSYQYLKSIHKCKKNDNQNDEGLVNEENTKSKNEKKKKTDE